MEPSGRNRWQPVANGAAAKVAQIDPVQTGHVLEGINRAHLYGSVIATRSWR